MISSFQMAFKRQSDLWNEHKEANKQADDIIFKAAQNGIYIRHTMGTTGPYLEYITYVLADGTTVNKVHLASLAWASDIVDIGPI